MKNRILAVLMACLICCPAFAGPFDGKTTTVGQSKKVDAGQFDSMKSLIQWVSSQKKGFFGKLEIDPVISANIDLAQSFSDLIYFISKTTDKDLKDRLVKMAAQKAKTPSEVLLAAKLVAKRSGAGDLRNGLVLDWAKTQARDLSDVVELVKYYRTILLEQRDEMDHRLIEAGVPYVKTQTDVDQLLSLQKYSIRRASLITLLKGQVKKAGLERITLPRE